MAIAVITDIFANNCATNLMVSLPELRMQKAKFMVVKSFSDFCGFVRLGDHSSNRRRSRRLRLTDVDEHNCVATA